MKNSNFKFIQHIFSLLILFFGLSLTAQQIENIDQYAAYISKRYEIPGMAIGVIDKGRVIHRAFYGTYDIENGTAVDNNSLFNLHSLSKVFVNVAVFKLIEEGKLDLEDEISKYIDDYPAHWEVVKVKHLLTHSSGIPNIIQYFDINLQATKKNLYAVEPVFAPGSYFDYNQSNYWLLNRIINKLSDEGFDNAVRKQINSSIRHPLLFDSEMPDGSIQPREYRPGPDNSLEVEYSDVHSYMNGAGGINISLDDFLSWNIKLDNDELISAHSKNTMWSPFRFDEVKHPFAHGWAIYNSNGTNSVGFSGGGVAGLRKFIPEDLTVIVLTNGYQYRFDVNTFISWIADHVRKDLPDLSADLHIELYSCFFQNSENKALKNFRILKSQNKKLDMDPILNSLGYELLAKGLVDQAMTVFFLNTREHPSSWNAWDSLAEGFETTGDLTSAIKYYEKSISLNPSTQYGIERVEELTKMIKTMRKN